MLRAAIVLVPATPALLCALLVGCGADDGGGDRDGGGDGDGPPVANSLRFVFDPMFSAFDGTHTYELPVLLDQSLFNTDADDFVMPESVKWTVDDTFVASEEFDDYPGSILLTTKQHGTTTIAADAMTNNGQRVRGKAQLKITRAHPTEWELGDAHYNMSCGGCHTENSGSDSATLRHTPLQTSGYSDEELIETFTIGAKPMTEGFTSPFLNMLPAEFARSIYTTIHSGDLAPKVQRGVLYRLRSITLKKH